MREILFSAKRKDNGQWVQGYLFKIWDKAYILWGTTNDIPNMIEVLPTTICEYTGLKDKNGTKIFEGDIVSFGVDLLLGEFIYPIEWKNDRVGFGYGGKADRMLEIDGEHCEVIGNKFDNPKLLEVQDEQAN